MANRFDRQINIIKQDKLNLPITIVGAGGIGSWVALSLAKMGCTKIKIYDFDKVEDHNVASQFFKESQLGEYKVNALKESIFEQTGINIYPFCQDINEVDVEEGLLIIAVDSMNVRKQIAEKYKDSNLYVIDGRMGGLQLEIYNMNANEYPQTIVSPEDVEPDMCTAKAISFNCMVIGGLICNLVRQYATNTIESGSLIYLFDNNTLLRKKYGKI